MIATIVVALAGASCGAGEEGEAGSTSASTSQSTLSATATATATADGSDTTAAAGPGSTSSSDSTGGAPTTAADGPDPSTSSTAADGTTEELATTGAVGDDWLEACVAEGPCDTFVLQCGLYRFGSDPQCVDVAYGAVLECAFEMFAEGTPGRFRYDFNGKLSGEDEWMDIVVVGDGTAVRQVSWEDPTDKDLVIEPIGACMLKPSAWFSDCAAVPVGDPMHETCFDVFEWFEDGCTTPATCP